MTISKYYIDIMFQEIKQRLLLSYLIVLISILGVFTIAIRIVFTRSLMHQLTDKLTALGQSAAANAEFENGIIKIESGFSVNSSLAQDQALQWFNIKENLIKQQGKNILPLPFSPHESVQRGQIGKTRIQAVTLPIVSSDERKLIGYVRASQSLEEFNETLHKLDIGLGGGIAIALLFSSIGGVILTRQAMQPIEESFQRLKQFTADASHELRSPLMVVKSNTAVALKYPEGMRGTDAEKFHAIASATNQMTRLTEDLLFLARTDKLPIHSKEYTNLTRILQDLIQLYQPQAKAKNISLNHQLTDNLHLLGDTVQLTRLFTNLIQNAINYTLPKGVINVTASQVGSYIIVKVQDTGVGIAPQDLAKIFERFWRADSSRAYWGGSGLGLAIAQAIAQNHDGLITVTSQSGVGSCFTVRLNTHISNIKSVRL